MWANDGLVDVGCAAQARPPGVPKYAFISSEEGRAHRQRIARPRSGRCLGKSVARMSLRVVGESEGRADEGADRRHGCEGGVQFGLVSVGSGVAGVDGVSGEKVEVVFEGSEGGDTGRGDFREAPRLWVRGKRIP